MKSKDLENFIKKLKKQKGKEYMQIFFSFVKLFADYFDYQADVYIKQLTKFPYMLNEKFSNKEFNNKIRQLLKQAFSLGAEEKKEELNKDFIRIGEKAKSITVNNKEILNYVKAHTGELIVQVDKTTQKEVNYLVQKSLLEGWTMDELTEKIKEKFKKYSYTRSALIAHMEIAQAFSVGSKTMIDKFSEKTNIQGWKRAKTQQDSLVRPSHKANEMDGWIPKDQVYSGTGTLHAPHGFFCRCDDIYSMITPPEYKENNISFYTENKIKIFRKNITLSEDSFDETNKNFITQNNLTTEEALALQYFTGNGYRIITNGFYYADTSETYQAVIPFFRNALNKLENTEGVFYRAHNFLFKGEKEELENLKVGNIFALKTYLSASKTFKNAKDHLKGKYIFKFITKNAKDIEDISILPAEKEVVFLPLQLFVVKEIEKKEDYTIITFEDL